MRDLKLVRLVGAMALLAAAPVLAAVAAYAQKSPMEQSGPAAGTDAPPSSKTTTPPLTSPASPQVIPMQPSMQAPSSGRGATLDVKPVPGLGVVTTDGQRIGEVAEVKTTSDGKIAAIHVKTRGLLGFGGRTVAVPPAKFTVAGQNVQLSMSATEVAKLPAVEVPKG
jgi:sporulation protein YlmC with PRC-barrel domain